MRTLSAFIVALSVSSLLISCSLLLHPEDKETPAPITSVQNQISLSVSETTVPLLQTDDYSAEEFPVVLSYDSGPFCKGTIRLRGQTTLEEYPRSFELDTRQDVTIELHSTQINRFSLIPFRSDTNFIYSLLGLHFYQKCSLFAPKWNITNVVLNGEELGTYLIVERSSDAMVRKMPVTEFVLRRRYGSFYDVKYYEPKDTANQLTRSEYAVAYETLHTLEKDNVLKTLEERMDLSAYLQAQGLHLIFANGDYNDELFYAGYARRTTQNVNQPYFTFSIWDLGELFSEPHNGNFTTGSLIFCNENRFDKMIESTPDLYKQYCSQLQNLLDSVITDENIASSKEIIEQLLHTSLRNDSILLGGTRYSKEVLLHLFDSTATLLKSRKADIQLKLDEL